MKNLLFLVAMCIMTGCVSSSKYLDQKANQSLVETQKQLDKATEFYKEQKYVVPNDGKVEQYVAGYKEIEVTMCDSAGLTVQSANNAKITQTFMARASLLSVLLSEGHMFLRLNSAIPSGKFYSESIHLVNNGITQIVTVNMVPCSGKNNYAKILTISPYTQFLANKEN